MKPRAKPELVTSFCRWRYSAPALKPCLPCVHDMLSAAKKVVSTWLLGASRENPFDDHLYLLPAAGGELVKLSDRPGRHIGALSPDGRRLAVVYGETTQLPDLFLRDPAPAAPEQRITVSGTDAYFRHRLVHPTMVSVPHPDGKPVWSAL